MATTLVIVNIASLLGLALFLLFRLGLIKSRQSSELTHEHWLELLSNIKNWFFNWGKKIWNFILEAKDIKTPERLTGGVQKVKQIFRVRVRHSKREPVWLPEATNIKVSSEENGVSTPEQIYLQAIKKNPQDKKAYEGLGRLYLQEKKFEEAIETFEFLTKLDEAEDVYWSNLGLCYFSTKDYRKAIEVYEKSLNLNSHVSSRWLNLGLCFEAIGEYVKAVKAATSAIELDPLNISYLNFLADLYLKIPNKVKAEEVLEKILEIDPTNRAIAEKLSKIKF
jgi:tetratricopeptide (TPR) repeat protein